MRVLILSWEYPPHLVGGLGAHVRSLVPALARQGVEVTVVTPRLKGGEEVERTPDGILVYRVDTEPQTSDIHAFAKQTNLRLQEVAEGLGPSHNGAGQGSGDFDIIHAHDWLVAFSGVSLKRVRRTPLVATMHATERGRCRGSISGALSNAINGIEWSLVYEAWRVIAVSQFMATEIKNYLGAPGDKVDVVPNGIDTSRLDEIGARDLQGFRALWARADESLVLFVGRMEYEKGVQVLVEAIPSVLQARPLTRFVLAGSGAMREGLISRINELGITKRVDIPGFISDEQRDQLLHVANASVFPSLYEPFGIVALEAMAAKSPVVVTRVGGLPEVVKANETGIVVNPDDPASLASGILQTLADPQAARSRAGAAYRVAREQYDWDRIAQQTISVYERVLSERAKVTWA